ncbi:MAG: hypothetical protein J7J75_02375 [Euryarchaeota archaeon]|nr:hypothetical protein [Euryarchaeota archaeon]
MRMITRLDGKFECVFPSLSDHRALARKVQQVLERSGYSTKVEEIKGKSVVLSLSESALRAFVPEVIDGEMNGFLDVFYDVVDEIKEMNVSEAFLVFNRPPMPQVVRYIGKLRKVLRVSVYPAYLDVDRNGCCRIVISRSSSWTKDVSIIAPENGQKVTVSTYRSAITAEAAFEYIYHVLGVRTIEDVRLIARQWGMSEEGFLKVMLRAAREKGYAIIRKTGEILPPWERHLVRESLR